MHIPFFIYIGLCLLIGLASRNKMMRFWGGFLLALLFTPLVMAVILVVSSPRD